MNNHDYFGKKFVSDGKVYTVYGVTPSGVFAHEGDEKRVDENGDVLNPRYFEFLYVDQNSVAVGRPSIGTTKKVSLTLEEKYWDEIEKMKSEMNVSQSAVLRIIIEKYFDEK